MLGEESVWGQGMGLEAIRLMLRYGFMKLNLNRIELGCYADHERGIKLYEKAGFKLEGRLRESVFHNGQYRDVVKMGTLRSDYLVEQKAKTEEG